MNRVEFDIRVGEVVLNADSLKEVGHYGEVFRIGCLTACAIKNILIT